MRSHRARAPPTGCWQIPDGCGELITYCTIGGRAATAWFVLTYLLGRDRGRVYDGSWAEWGCLPGTPSRARDRLPPDAGS